MPTVPAQPIEPDELKEELAVPPAAREPEGMYSGNDSPRDTTSPPEPRHLQELPDHHKMPPQAGGVQPEAADSGEPGPGPNYLPSRAEPDSDLLESGTRSTTADADLQGPELATIVLPNSPSQLAQFGEQGKVTPVPRRLIVQPADVFEHVPDTAIEWADREIPGQAGRGLSMRAVSLRGHSHRIEGSIRQDQMAIGEIGGTWIAAVSDGLGGEPHSHLGAAMASRLVVGWTEAEMLLDSDASTLSCTAIASALRFEARQRGLNPSAVSATLTFAVVDTKPAIDDAGDLHWRVAVAQIGDSHAYILRNGTWSRVTQADEAVEGESAPSNVVDPLPGHTDAHVWHLEVASGDTLALMSDGVWPILVDQLVPGFAESIANQWLTAAPSPTALLFVLDAAVKSYDDDRTFVGIRFGGV